MATNQTSGWTPEQSCTAQDMPRWFIIICAICALIVAISALLLAIATICILAQAGAEAVMAGGNSLPMWLVSFMVASVGGLLSADFFICRRVIKEFAGMNKTD